MMRLKWKELAFRRQVTLVFLATATVTVFISILCCYAIMRTSSTSERETRLDTMLNEIKWGFDSNLEKMSEYSRLISFSSEVQTYLNHVATNPGDAVMKTKIESSTISILTGSTWIDSVYIYDWDGNSYAATDNTWRNEGVQHIKSAAWYDDVIRAKGGAVVRLNSNGFLDQTGSDFLSVIRLINDIDTLRPIGILIVNMPISSVLDAVDPQCMYQIRSVNGSMLHDSSGSGIAIAAIAKAGGDARQFTIHGADFWGKSIAYESADLIISVAEQSKVITAVYWRYFWLVIFVCVLTMLSILATARILERSVEKPLQGLLSAMDQITDTQLAEIEIIQTNRDMTLLQNGYNRMVCIIQKLFDNVLEEQKQKRKYELTALNAQIRPHFLYNTFDAVCALALMDRSHDVYMLMQALGKYYRTSLHKGDELIKLREELVIIRNYAVIQQYRFENVFDIVYDIDQSLLDSMVLKLILQPFVENAIYHGLKTKSSGGQIIIAGRRDGERMILSISDNGIGMNEDRICHILNGEGVDEDKSFGVYGTIERIRLHYGEETPVTITSAEGQGTTVAICIPLSFERSAASNAEDDRR